MSTSVAELPSRETILSFLIWLGTLVFILAAMNFVTAPKYAIEWLADRRFFTMLIAAPGVIVAGWPIVRTWFSRGHLPLPNSERILLLLVLYCVYVVAATGGLANSPFTALIPIVPLLGSSLLAAKKKAILTSYIISVFVLVSLWLSPLQGYLNAPDPSEIPSNGSWDCPALSHHVIVAALTLLAIFGELLMLDSEQSQELSQ